MTCEVCDRRLSPKTRGTVCARCREDGAAFARRWMAALKAAGERRKVIAEVLDVEPDVVSARLYEMKAAA